VVLFIDVSCVEGKERDRERESTIKEGRREKDEVSVYY